MTLPLHWSQLGALLVFVAIGSHDRSAAPAPPSQGASAAADSVRALDQRWARAYATHDTVFARALFSDDLVVTATNGSSKDKEGEVADVRPFAGTTVEYFRSTDVKVRAYEGAVVVTGTLEWRLVGSGGPSDTRRRYTATYVRGGPLRWRMVALHVGQAR